MAPSNTIQRQQLANAKKLFEAAGQGHIFDFLDTATELELESFLLDLNKFDVNTLSTIFKNAFLESKLPSVCPLSTSVESSAMSADEYKRLRNVGIDAIARGKCCFLVMAGGQGTRLGYDGPKGIYDIGMPSHSSLFQRQAEQILRLQKIAGEYAKSKPASEYPCNIMWYIMASDVTVTKTAEFLKDKNYFGLKQSQVMIFTQGMLPAFDKQGKIVLESKTKLALAPDGNGGIFNALVASGILGHMKSHRIEGVFCAGIDNALIRVCDPLFMGVCMDKGYDIGVKTVPKAYPSEAVGVVCNDESGKCRVVEYTELPANEREKVDPISNKLLYGHANIATHYFSVQFLDRVCGPSLDAGLSYHVAFKKVPCVDDKGEHITPAAPNAYKMERFIFDVFPYANNYVVYNVPREYEFAPVKNAPGSAVDSPDTARKLMTKMYVDMITKHGGKVLGDATSSLAEISPLVTYDGEGLENVVDGHTYTLPVHIAPI